MSTVSFARALRWLLATLVKPAAMRRLVDSLIRRFADSSSR